MGVRVRARVGVRVRVRVSRGERLPPPPRVLGEADHRSELLTRAVIVEHLIRVRASVSVSVRVRVRVCL